MEKMLMLQLNVSKQGFDYIKNNYPNAYVKDHHGERLDFDGFTIIPVTANFQDDTKHPTEEKYPEQTKRFRELLDEIYQTHLKKNADYSPANILATGIVGLGTRIWDKTIRFVSLLGLDTQTGKWNNEKVPANEPINDTLLDLATYAIIALVFREDKWGK